MKRQPVQTQNDPRSAHDALSVIPAQAGMTASNSTEVPTKVSTKVSAKMLAGSASTRCHRTRQQGSLLVLVVVTLVLMALLGTAYLQVARVDRFATADYHQNDIDQVANATINYIGKILRDDLVNKDGGFFSPIKGTNAANVKLSYEDGYGDESYDYPWTNPAYINLWPVKLDDATTGTADGGLYDDTWLASNVPSFNASTESSWNHVSNLMGTFLQIPTIGGPLLPTEAPTKATGAIWNTDTNVPIGHTAINLANPATANHLPLGTDTDMDGIPDAKWQWAPLRQIGSKKYVMAVRIIDNSAMINLNTATSITADGNTVSTARGYFPSEIDLSRITSRMPSVQPLAGSGPFWYNELASTYALRGVSNATMTPYGTATIDAAGQVNWATAAVGSYTRADAWLETIRLWADPTNKLALANEMELRRLGGVNNDNVTTDIENAMNVMLRRDHTELTFADVATYGGYPGGLTANEQVMAYFLGVDTSNAGNPESPVTNRQFPAMRNQFTTQSAAAIYASNAGNLNSSNGTTAPPVRTLKYDLIHGDGGNTLNNSTRMAAIYGRLLKIFRINNAGSAPNTGDASAYLGLDKTITAERNTLSDIAYEYAVAIQDYSDPDRLPSSVTPVVTGPNTYNSNPTGRTYYGLETLPFFREGYVQAAYQNQDLATVDGLPDTFIYTVDSMALAFEIGNPFDRTIDFDAATPNPAIRVKVGSNLYPLAGTLNSQQTRVFYANTIAANRKDEGTEGTPRGDLLVDLALTAGPDVVALAEGPTYTVGTRILFELQVEVVPGTWVTYDRLAPDLGNPQMVYVPSDAHGQLATAADLDLYHFELFDMVRPVSIGAAAGPYYISGFNNDRIRFPALSDRNVFQANSDQLTLTAKTNSGGAPLDGDPVLTDYQLPSANRQFMSVAELGIIHMFGFYTNLGNLPDNEIGDFPTRMRDMAANRRRLVLNDPAGPNPTNGIPMQMPHAALLFDQFTTLSPRNDGTIDNDNDGTIDNEAEQVVHGQININTAPLHLLTLAAPLNESIDEIQAFMQSLIHYRDNPSARAAMSSVGPTTITRPEFGIASIGELLLLDGSSYDSAAIDPTLKPTANMLAPRSRMNYYASKPFGSFTGTNLDLYPMLGEAATPRDASQDGNEARLARFQFLSQTFNTRSDTFTAYVRLRGYPSQDFSKGEVESRSFLVVFDRSNIVSASDMPRIVGVYVYNVP